MCARAPGRGGWTWWPATRRWNRRCRARTCCRARTWHRGRIRGRGPGGSRPAWKNCRASGRRPRRTPASRGRLSSQEVLRCRGSGSRCSLPPGQSAPLSRHPGGTASASPGRAGAAGSHCLGWPDGGHVPQAGQSALAVVWYWPGASGCQSFACTLSTRPTATGLLAGSLRERDSSFRGLWPRHGLASGGPRFNGRVRGCRIGQAVTLTHDGCEPALSRFSQGAGFEVAEAAWALEDAGAGLPPQSGMSCSLPSCTSPSPACNRALCPVPAWWEPSMRGCRGGSSWCAARPGSARRRCWPTGPGGAADRSRGCRWMRVTMTQRSFGGMRLRRWTGRGRGLASGSPRYWARRRLRRSKAW